MMTDLSENLCNMKIRITDILLSPHTNGWSNIFQSRMKKILRFVSTYRSCLPFKDIFSKFLETLTDALKTRGERGKIGRKILLRKNTLTIRSTIKILPLVFTYFIMCLRNKKYHYDLENGHISV